MDSASWDRLADLYERASALPPEARDAFIASPDVPPSLRDELRSLLADRTEADAFASDLEAAISPILPGNPASDDQALGSGLSDGARLGRYRTVREIGRGGMGRVYLAEQEGEGFARRVALKLMREAGPRVVRRFLAERQILARLRHEGIARLLDVGMAEGPGGERTPYFAMEYVDGQPLPDYCDERRLSVPERLALFEQVCEAVRYAHQNLVVHRDLKPSNILVEESADGTARVKLLDFGIAKLLEEASEKPEEPITLTSDRLMTPAYAAPEQITGDAITTSTDVYQLGVLLYELLTGQRPFHLPERLQHEVARVILEEQPTRPSTLVAKSGDTGAATAGASEARATTPARLQRRLRGDLDSIVLMALRKDPARRYPSAEALLDDLRRHRDGRVVAAQPDSFAYVARRYVRRHRAGVAVAATLALLLLAYAATVTVQNQRIADQRDRAEQQEARAVELYNFTYGILAESNPRNTPGGDELTAATLLQRAAQRLETDLAEDPATRSSLEHTLATIYYERSQTEEALRHGTLSMSYAEEAGDSLLIAAAAYALASAYEQVGAIPEADSLARLAYETSYRHLGRLHEETNMARNLLGLIYLYNGPISAAQPLLEEAVAVSREIGEPPEKLGTVLNNLASVYEQQEDYVRAEAVFREALAIRRASRPEGHPDVAQGANNLANILREAGQYDEAEALYLEALRINEAALGPKHIGLVAINANLSNLHRRQDRREEALAYMRAAFEVVPDGQAVTQARLLQGIGSMQIGWGERAEGMESLREAVAIMQRELPPGHPYLARALLGQAAAYAEEGEYESAVPPAREAAAALLEAYGPENGETQTAHYTLAYALAQTGALADAAEAYRSTLSIMPADHPRLAQTQAEADSVNALLQSL
jgi:serine/threonine-protein kinase